MNNFLIVIDEIKSTMINAYSLFKPLIPKAYELESSNLKATALPLNSVLIWSFSATEPMLRLSDTSISCEREGGGGGERWIRNGLIVRFAKQENVPTMFTWLLV